MPLQAFWRILIWSFRSSQMLGRSWYQEKAFIFDWKNLILARKCLANRIINAVWFSLPISVSSFLDFVSSFDKDVLYFFQATDLGSCKFKQNVSVLYTHPKTTLIFSNEPSSFYFDGWSFRLWVPVIFELMDVRRHGLQVEFMRFLWIWCCQYQVWLFYAIVQIYVYLFLRIDKYVNS